MNDQQKQCCDDLYQYYQSIEDKPIQLNEYDIIRFARTSPGPKKFVFEPSKKMLDEYFKLFRKHNIYYININDFINECKKRRIIYTNQYDKEGNLVVYINVSNIIPTDIPEEWLVRYMIGLTKLLTNHEKTCIEGFTCIIDFKGSSMSNVSIRLVKLFIYILTGKMAVRIKNLYIINYSMWLNTVFKMLYMFIPSAFHKKMHFVKDYDDFLELDIDYIQSDKLIDDIFVLCKNDVLFKKE